MFDINLIASIDTWIEKNKDNYLKDISSLIEIKSVSNEGEDGYVYGKGCHDVLLKAKEIVSSYGFESENKEDKYLVVKAGSEDGKEIGIFNHLDVVPEGSGWENEPYKLTVKDGYLIGRGVADNKGAAVASLYALKYLKEHDIRLKHPVILFYGAAEETGMDDIEFFRKNYDAPYFSLIPDSDFPICHGEKGNMRFTLKVKNNTDLIYLNAGEVINSVPSSATAKIKGKYDLKNDKVDISYSDGITTITALGKAGHAAFPEQSDNAVRRLFEVLSTIDGISNETKKICAMFHNVVKSSYGEGLGITMEDDVSGKLTAMGTVLRGDEDCISLSFDARTPVKTNIEDVDNILKDFATRNGFEYILDSSSSPSYTPLDNEIAKLLCSIAEYVHNREMKPYTMGGGTYARKLPFALGFGPGLKDAPNLYPEGKGRGHQSDECILLSLLLSDIKALILALISLDEIIE